MKALVLAAGEGRRLRPLTLDRPKPMLPIAGRPLLEHLVALLAAHGIREIAINLHYHPEAIVDHLGDGSRFGVRITYSHEPRLLGSAGAARLDWFSTITSWSSTVTSTGVDLSAWSTRTGVRRRRHDRPEPGGRSTRSGSSDRLAAVGHRLRRNRRPASSGGSRTADLRP
jgi:hypothetical protein